MSVQRQIILTFLVNFSGIASLLPRFVNVIHLDIELVRWFQAKLVQYSPGKSIHMLQYLPSEINLLVFDLNSWSKVEVEELN